MQGPKHTTQACFGPRIACVKALHCLHYVHDACVKSCVSCAACVRLETGLKTHYQNKAAPVMLSDFKLQAIFCRGQREKSNLTKVWRPIQHTTRHFRDDSSQEINCTGIKYEKVTN